MNDKQKYYYFLAAGLGIVILLAYFAPPISNTLTTGDITSSCTDKQGFEKGQVKELCGVEVKLISETSSGIHTGSQSRYHLIYPGGETEDWMFNDPASRYYLNNGYAFENTITDGISTLKVTKTSMPASVDKPNTTKEPTPTATSTPAATATQTPSGVPVNIKLTSIPPGASVSVGGKTIGDTPLDIQIFAGQTKIAYLSKDGYKTQPAHINGVVSEYTVRLEEVYTPQGGNAGGTYTNNNNAAGEENESILDNPYAAWSIIGVILAGTIWYFLIPGKKTRKGK